MTNEQEKLNQINKDLERRKKNQQKWKIVGLIAGAIAIGVGIYFSIV